MFNNKEFPDLESHIEKWFPSCTLCNDIDYWTNGTLCICNEPDLTLEFSLSVILEMKAGHFINFPKLEPPTY